MTAPLHTPSLRMRLIAAGMVTLLVLVVLLDVFVFVSLRTQLLASLEDLLDTRAALARELGATLTPPALDERLTELGVPAAVRLADGEILAADPVAPGFGDGPPGPSPSGPGNAEAREVQLSDGVTVTVFASRAGVEQTLEQILLFETVGTVGVLLLMLVLLVRMSRVLLNPIDHVVVTARGIAAGRAGQRLRPDRPDTELGRMAVAFDEMLDSLEGAVEQAQEAEREAREAEAGSRRFLADAAHQLRTPLAGLRASVDSLMRTEQPDEQQRLLDNLARESARTGRLVSSLLRVAQLDRGDTPNLIPADVVALVAEEVERARAFSPLLVIAHEHRIEAAPIDADPDGIREALSNVLDNARRHARHRVDVRTAIVGGRVEVSITDDGPGLPVGSEARAFERFTTFDGRGGSGLGLAIARGVAGAHGGDLTYRDGAFVLRLPLAAGDANPDTGRGDLASA